MLKPQTYYHKSIHKYSSFHSYLDTPNLGVMVLGFLGLKSLFVGEEVIQVLMFAICSLRTTAYFMYVMFNLCIILLGIVYTLFICPIFSILFPIVFNCGLLFFLEREGVGGGGGRKLKRAKIEGSRNLKGIRYLMNSDVVFRPSRAKKISSFYVIISY